MWDFFKELVIFCAGLFQEFKPGSNDVIERIASIYDQMRSVINADSFDCQRVLIGKTHNGGGDLRPDSPLFMSVIHEEVRSPMISVKKKYQCIPVDSAGIVILQQIRVNGFFDINVANMQDGFLKDLYREEKIISVRIYFLKKTKKGLWFCSFATTNELQSFDQLEFKVAAKLAVGAIKQKI